MSDFTIRDATAQDAADLAILENLASHSLAVYPADRGQGVGAALLNHTMQQGKRLGHERMSLVAEDSNGSALPLYHKHGFIEVERRPFISFGTKSNTQNWLLLSTALS